METRYPLTGFVDEISPDLRTQMATAKSLGLTGVDIRSVDGINVLDLTEDQLDAVRISALDFGLSVQCVASPVNKVPYTPQHQEQERERLKRAIHAAHRLGTKRIRVFSPEVPEADYDAAWTGVEAWMAEQIAEATAANLILVHENDARYYGAYPKGAKKLMEAHHGPHFRFAFDFANTVQLGFSPMADWYPWVQPYLDTVHIKDAIRETKQVVPAGEGDGEVAAFVKGLVESGWKGTFSMEPHLESAGKFGGFSGPQLYEVATLKFKGIMESVGGRAGW